MSTQKNIKTENLLGIIGGSGFDKYPELREIETINVETPFGESVSLSKGSLSGRTLLFMPRHGADHSIAPHNINYRANIWALRLLGVTHVLAINAVGGIRSDMKPGAIAIPDQIIDYSYGREHTFYGDSARELNNKKPKISTECFLTQSLDHIDFTFPYEGMWREFVLQCAKKSFPSVVGDGVYGCTQGPRLETAAEISRLKKDGCDVVGMTGMPEAALARELGLSYACLAISVNWAAGLSDELITFEKIKDQLSLAMSKVKKIIEDLDVNQSGF